MRTVLVALGTVMTRVNVEISFPYNLVVDDVFRPDEHQHTSLQSQLDELVTLATVLSPLRA